LFYSHNHLGVFGLILAGAALGFLPYNYHPAKIFMGDSGSMFLGFSLAAVSVSGTARHISNFFIAMLIPVLILSVPLFDTMFVMALRKMQGRKIFEGGRDHTSHHLVTLGLSQRKTVLLLYGISIAFGLIGIFYTKINIFVICATSFLALVVLLFFGFFLYEISPQSKFNPKPRDLANKTTLISIFFYKRRVVEVLLDFGLICIAYYAAYFLRFEGKQFILNAYILKDSLVWIILIKMAVFFTCGLYRGVWRYISISDLFTIFRAVSLGTIASILFLTFIFRFQEYSRAVFFIDWLLLLLLVSGTRMLFRVLGELFSRAREKGNNVLIFGAGDTGEMVIREIKRNKQLNYNAVGFIDDNPAKAGSKIQGVEVLGGREIIGELARIHKIKEVIVAVPAISASDLSEIARICREYGIEYRKIKGILDKDETPEFRQN
jgi:UDP-GlcNAc:undecaprenyl-phosphate GlcNAc-1-phosphate transferase